MILRSLTRGVQTKVISAGAAAGTTAVNCSVIDMFGYEGVRAIAILGALTATQVTYLKAQGSNTNNGTDWVDLASTKTGPALDADGNKTLILDLYRPGYRFLQFVLVRGTANAVLLAALAELFVAQREPVAQDSTVSAQVVLPYAAAGTP